MNSPKKAKLVAIFVGFVAVSFCVGYWLAVVNKPLPSARERREMLADELRAAIEDAGLDLGLAAGEPCAIADDDPAAPDPCALGLVCRGTRCEPVVAEQDESRR